MAPTEPTPVAGPPSPVAPLLDWDLGPASVATVLATVTDLPTLVEGGEGAWVTPFCLLACDYLRAAMATVEPGMVPQVLILMFEHARGHFIMLSHVMSCILESRLDHHKT